MGALKCFIGDGLWSSLNSSTLSIIANNIVFGLIKVQKQLKLKEYLLIDQPMIYVPNVIMQHSYNHSISFHFIYIKGQIVYMIIIVYDKFVSLFFKHFIVYNKDK